MIGNTRRRLATGLAAATTALLLTTVTHATARPAPASPPRPDSTAATATVTGTTSCPGVWFIGARGSGEKVRNDGKPVNDGMGPEVDYLSKLVAAGAEYEDLTYWHTPVSYAPASSRVLAISKAELAMLLVNRKAFLTHWVKHNLAKYDASLTDGITATVADVRNAVAQCPAAQLVLSGYSQGATAVHDAENILHRKYPRAFTHIKTTLLLGDGDRAPNSAAHLFGTAPATSQGIRDHFHLTRARDVPAPATTAEI